MACLSLIRVFALVAVLTQQLAVINAQNSSDGHGEAEKGEARKGGKGRCKGGKGQRAEHDEQGRNLLAAQDGVDGTTASATVGLAAVAEARRVRFLQEREKKDDGEDDDNCDNEGSFKWVSAAVVSILVFCCACGSGALAYFCYRKGRRTGKHEVTAVANVALDSNVIYGVAAGTPTVVIGSPAAGTPKAAAKTSSA